MWLAGPPAAKKEISTAPVVSRYASAMANAGMTCPAVSPQAMATRRCMIGVLAYHAGRALKPMHTSALASPGAAHQHA